MIFESPAQSIDLPRNIDIWNWLFNEDVSPLKRPEVRGANEIGCFVDGLTNKALHYQEVKELAVWASTCLKADYGLKEQDVVLTCAFNSIYYGSALWSVLRSGGIISGCSPLYLIDELVYALQKVKARFLFVSVENLQVAKKAAAQVGLDSTRIFLMEGQAAGHLNVEDLAIQGRKHGQPQPAYCLPKGKTNGEVCAFISFSSGTTGLPKGVRISHQNVIAQALQMQVVSGFQPHTERTIAVLPAFHITGLVQLLHVPIMNGQTCIMLKSFEMKSFLETVVKFKITNLMLVPPIIIKLVRDPIVKNYDLSHVKMFMSGAAPLSEEIIGTLRKLWPQAGLWQGYGMTESASCITSTPRVVQSDPKFNDSVGLITPSTQLKIIDPETGKELDYDEPGEILARGPQVVMGYLDNPKATAETFDQEGFLHTGDIGIMRHDGRLQITDRLKEMIKVKGVPVAPAELENVLLSHDIVEDCAVFGMPDPEEYRGELIVAYVVLKSHYRESHEKASTVIQDFVKSKLSRNKAISGGVTIVKEIPKSPSGKILRRILRDLEREKMNQAKVRAKL